MTHAAPMPDPSASSAPHDPESVNYTAAQLTMQRLKELQSKSASINGTVVSNGKSSFGNASAESFQPPFPDSNGTQERQGDVGPAAAVAAAAAPPTKRSGWFSRSHKKSSSDPKAPTESPSGAISSGRKQSNANGDAGNPSGGGVPGMAGLPVVEVLPHKPDNTNCNEAETRGNKGILQQSTVVVLTAAGKPSHKRHRSLSALLRFGRSNPPTNPGSTDDLLAGFPSSTGAGKIGPLAAGAAGPQGSISAPPSRAPTPNQEPMLSLSNNPLSSLETHQIHPSNALLVSGSAFRLEIDRGPVLPPGLRGLKNVGNSCFVNSALQCLRFTPGLPLALVPDLLQEELIPEQQQQQQQEENISRHDADTNGAIVSHPGGSTANASLSSDPAHKVESNSKAMQLESTLLEEVHVSRSESAVPGAATPSAEAENVSSGCASAAAPLSGSNGAAPVRDAVLDSVDDEKVVKNEEPKADDVEGSKEKLVGEQSGEGGNKESAGNDSAAEPENAQQQQQRPSRGELSSAIASLIRDLYAPLSSPTSSTLNTVAAPAAPAVNGTSPSTDNNKNTTAATAAAAAVGVKSITSNGTSIPSTPPRSPLQSPTPTSSAHTTPSGPSSITITLSSPGSTNLALRKSYSPNYLGRPSPQPPATLHVNNTSYGKYYNTIPNARYGGKCVDPSGLMQALQGFPAAAELLDGRQHDAQEALRVLMDLLHEDLNKGSAAEAQRVKVKVKAAAAAALRAHPLAAYPTSDSEAEAAEVAAEEEVEEQAEVSALDDEPQPQPQLQESYEKVKASHANDSIPTPQIESDDEQKIDDDKSSTASLENGMKSLALGPTSAFISSVRELKPETGCSLSEASSNSAAGATNNVQIQHASTATGTEASYCRSHSCDSSATETGDEKKDEKKESESDEDEDESIKALRQWQEYQARDDSPIVDLFCGQLQSSVTCHKCKKRYTMYEPFFDLSLPLAREGKPSSRSWLRPGPSASIQDCLTAFTADETLEGEEAFHCKHCKEKTPATKHLRVHHFPDALVLHMKRFRHRGAATDKLTMSVSFPLEGLSLAVYASPECPQLAEDCIYDLYAVSNHSGSLGGGHYTAMCRVVGPEGSDPRWYSFNDESVSPVLSTQVVSQNAYILFYTRRKYKKVVCGVGEHGPAQQAQHGHRRSGSSSGDGGGGFFSKVLHRRDHSKGGGESS